MLSFGYAYYVNTEAHGKKQEMFNSYISYPD